MRLLLTRRTRAHNPDSASAVSCMSLRFVSDTKYKWTQVLRSSQKLFQIRNDERTNKEQILIRRE